MNTAKIFVTTYSLYNQGRQFESDKTGFWLDCADYDHDQLMENFNEVDPECKDDHELMFTDFEGFPESLYSESCIAFASIAAWEALDEDQKEIAAALVEHGISMTMPEAIDKAADCFIFDGSLVDYAIEYYESCYEIPDHLQGYIDWDAIARDMSYDGNLIELGRDRLLVIG